MKERELQANVYEAAGVFGWLIYHTYDSRRSSAGFPDLVLVRAPRVIFAELKAENGVITLEQRNWLGQLGACTGIESYLWRPSDWDDILEKLR